MNIKSGTEAMVFNPRINPGRKNTITATISTYEGKNQDGSRKYCSWYTHFVGRAYETAVNLKDKDKIIVTNANIENQYNKEQERLYITLTVFDFEMRKEGEKVIVEEDIEETIIPGRDKDAVYFEDDSISPSEFAEGDTYKENI